MLFWELWKRLTIPSNIIVSICRKLPYLSACKNFIIHFFLKTAKKNKKTIANLLFWVIWTCLAMHTQSCTINLYKTFVFICRQKINLSHTFFWRYCKDMQSYYFGYVGHASLRTPKMIVSTCRKLLYLLACQKINNKKLFATILGPFFPKFGQKWICLGKKGSVSF